MLNEPLVVSAGIIWNLGVLVGTLGLIHPPVCTVLNVVCGISKISLESATKGIWPFLLVYIFLIALFVAFPGIITVPMTWYR